MTTFRYTSKSTLEVQPSIVKLTFNISADDYDAKTSIDKLKSKLDALKNTFNDLQSVNSYKQTNISFTRLSNKEYYYVNTKNNKRHTVEEYNKMPQETRDLCEKRYKDVPGPYVSSISATVVLNYGETTVNDFTDLMNFSVENNIRLNYNHTITDAERETYMNQLYANCINEGMANIRAIAIKTDVLDDENIELESVTDNSFEPDRGIMYKSAEMSDTVRTQYFIPELVEELFNNNITLTKELELRVIIG